MNLAEQPFFRALVRMRVGRWKGDAAIERRYVRFVAFRGAMSCLKSGICRLAGMREPGDCALVR